MTHQEIVLFLSELLRLPAASLLSVSDAELRCLIHHFKAVQLGRKEPIVEGGTSPALVRQWVSCYARTTESTGARDLSILISCLEGLRAKRFCRKQFSEAFSLCSEFDFGLHKQSDTLFILGTGPSLSLISESGFEHIGRHDSFGINHFLLHPFEAGFYSFEIPFVSSVRQANLHNLGVKAKALQRRPVLFYKILMWPESLLRMSLAGPADLPTGLRDRIYLTPTCELFAENVGELPEVLRCWQELGFFRPGAKLDLQLTIRSSLFDALHFGVQGAYRSIVLCGVDLNRGGYFFDASPEKLRRNGYQVPENFADSGGGHVANDAEVHPVTIEEAVYCLDETVLRPLGIDLWVDSTQSALSRKLPLYPGFQRKP